MAHLRDVILRELSKRLPDSVLEELMSKGGVLRPGGPGCSGDCTGNCHGQCLSSCTGACQGSCGNNCSGTCSGDCVATCTGTCAGTAKNTAETPHMTPEDLINRYILTVMQPAMESIRTALLLQNFPR